MDCNGDPLRSGGGGRTGGDQDGDPTGDLKPSGGGGGGGGGGGASHSKHGGGDGGGGGSASHSKHGGGGSARGEHDGSGVGEKAGERPGDLLSDDSSPVPMNCAVDSALVRTLSLPDVTVRRTGGSEMALAECHLNRLSDDLMGKIMSYLGSDEGARFALFCSRWRNVWRSTPLVVDDHLFSAGRSIRLLLQFINGAVANHPGPVRRLSFSRLPLAALSGAIDEWMRGSIFNGLSELILDFPGIRRELPMAMIRLGSVHILHLTNCIVPMEARPTLPFIKDLRLVGVVISEDTLQGILTSASNLQILVLSLTEGYSSLCLPLPNLEHLILSMNRYLENKDAQQLVSISVEGASNLSRFLIEHDGYAPSIIIKGAVRLHIFGHLGRDIPFLLFENTSFKAMLPRSLANVFSSVTILSLKVETEDLLDVLKILHTVPCLQTLHMHLKSPASIVTSLGSSDDCALPDCLHRSLKQVFFWSYLGCLGHSKFARYFTENAQGVELFRFQTCQIHSASWLKSQQNMLNFDGKVSSTARIEFAVEGPSSPTVDQLIRSRDPFGLMMGQPYYLLKAPPKEVPKEDILETVPLQ